MGFKSPLVGDLADFQEYKTVMLVSAELCNRVVDLFQIFLPILIIRIDVEGIDQGCTGLLETYDVHLALAEPLQHAAEIVLGRGPVGRRGLTGSDLQRGAIGGKGLFEPRRAGLAFADGIEHRC